MCIHLVTFVGGSVLIALRGMMKAVHRCKYVMQVARRDLTLTKNESCHIVVRPIDISMSLMKYENSRMM